jgi:hypothetical protein
MTYLIFVSRVERNFSNLWILLSELGDFAHCQFAELQQSNFRRIAGAFTTQDGNTILAGFEFSTITQSSNTQQSSLSFSAFFAGAGIIFSGVTSLDDSIIPAKRDCY